MTDALRMLLLVVVALALGCNDNRGGADAGIDLGSLVDSSTDLTLGTALCQPASTSVPTQLGRGGSVTFVITQASSTNGFAKFNTVQLDGGTGQQSCGTTVLDGCRLVACTNTNLPPRSFNESVGIIQITGGNMPVSFTPAADKTYPDFLQSMGLWNGGEALTFNAPGADQPGFNLIISAPVPVTLLQPTATTGQPVVVKRSQDLNLSWVNAQTPGIVSASIVVINLTANAFSALECEFPVESGGGSVPSMLLQGLPAGPADFSLDTTCAQSREMNGVQVFLQLSIEANSSSVKFSSGNMTLQ